MAIYNFPDGVSTDAGTGPLAMFGLPDPTEWHVWFDDFDNYQADQWVITTTEAGGSSATEAVALGENHGVLLITNDTNDTDADYLQWSGATGTAAAETFKFVAGKKMFFKTRFKISDVTDTAVVIGLQLTDTTPLDVTDGVFFIKADTETGLKLAVEKNSTQTLSSSLATLVNDTYVVAAFYYNGVDAITPYINGTAGTALAVTNLVDDEELTVSFGILNGSAAGHVLSIDYIFVANER